MWIWTRSLEMVMAFADPTDLAPWRVAGTWIGLRSDTFSANRLEEAVRWTEGSGVAEDAERSSEQVADSDFGELFGRHEPDVARVCRRLLGAGDAAEDASSEVYLRARRAFASYDRDRPFRPWLLQIAGHLCIDRLRRRGTEARLFEDADLVEEQLADRGASPLRLAVNNQRREAVASAIDALPAKYRLPLVLRYFSELDYQGIAEVLDVSRNQVGTLLLRGKRRLRETLTEEDTPR